MTDTLIEAVSKALARRSWEMGGNDEHEEAFVNRRWPNYTNDARAAILATLEGIKEPTDAMKDAGEDGQCEPDFDEAGRVWQAMLTSLIDELKGDL